jgi:hypothetical protein
MESNGVRGRIHVSQSTADELTAHGKSDWLTPREDKITAKGKGEMQTYWVSPSSMASSVATRSIANTFSSFGDDEPAQENGADTDIMR